MKKQLLDNGAKLMIVDDASPEDIAMLQALYSRSAESAEVHLDKVKATGSGKFMSSFYVGYGHKSIADCGSTTMFIEGVSLLAAKAIQDWPLYSGQETSTRYINMAKQRIVDPIGTRASTVILGRWMDFYSSNQERVAQTVRERHPMREDEKPEIYERAVKARTFDILRGFLPAGITTQLSWHTNLRQAADHLNGLRYHRTHEVTTLAAQLSVLLAEAYPSSGFDAAMAAVSGVDNKDAEARAQRAQWEEAIGAAYTYGLFGADRQAGVEMQAHGRALNRLHDVPMLATRPRGCVLPHFCADYGVFTFNFQLDFGSFRDLQRHRNGVCRMPLLDTSLGFEPWYLEQLDAGLCADAAALISEQRAAIIALGADPAEKQYLTALGFRVPCQITYALPALLYVLELRTGKMIHPTLRSRMRSCANVFRERFPFVALHNDTSPDDWDVRRGAQTIHAK